MMLCFDTNFLHYLGSSSFQHIEGKSPSFQHPSQPGRIDGLKWIESFDASQAPSRDVGPLVGKRCVLVKDWGKNQWRGTIVIARWWFQIFVYFHPYLGKIPILTNIFQGGWNHQLYRIVYLIYFDGFRSLKSGIVYCVFCLCCILFCSTYIMLCIYRIHESYNTWSTYRGEKENWRELLATLPPGLLCSKYIDGADVHTRKYFPQQVAHQWAVAETVTSPKFQASGNIWKPYWRCPSLIIF